jgi:hypothetical protein
MIERDKARVARERGGERRRERGREIITFWQRMEHIACGRGPSAASLRGVASCSLACLSGLSADGAVSTMPREFSCAPAETGGQEER